VMCPMDSSRRERGGARPTTGNCLWLDFVRPSRGPVLLVSASPKIFMKTKNMKHPVQLWWFAILVLLGAATGLDAQTRFVASDVAAGTAGNQAVQGRSVASDFYVNRPITIWQLGVFDDGTNGISGSGTVTVQLYARGGNRGELLETLTFDAASSGVLSGANRFKPLAAPVTLPAGLYSVVAYGFDETNRWAKAAVTARGTFPLATLNDGGGQISFGLVYIGTVGKNFFPTGGETNLAQYCAAGTFVYSAADVMPPPYAAHYAMLTDGVTNFYFGQRRRIGSIALFHRNAFPVLVEPSGNRLVLEAASVYGDDPNGSRCVAFSHFQWAYARGGSDGRRRLFQNAIQWASRKSTPAEVVIGLGPFISTNTAFLSTNSVYFENLGYEVRPFGAKGTDLPECDVLVVDWHAGFDKTAVEQMKGMTARGVGLVMSASPWLLVHGGVQPAFGEANELLEPFGLAYRPSTTIVSDFGFTNIQAQAYSRYFSAFIAAEKLGQEKQGGPRLDSLEKLLAMHTINYALNARPDLLPVLSAISSGREEKSTSLSAGAVTDFSNVALLAGVQASTNRLGPWVAKGTDLAAADRRGSVDYDFAISEAGVYRVVIRGVQDVPNSRQKEFRLILSLDGTSLGNHVLGSNGLVACWTPYLAAGAHTLRIFWDNAASFTSLRLRSVQVEKPAAAERGTARDWADQFVQSRSGTDQTNELLTSYVSPLCLEGRDPYPSLMRIRGSAGEVQVIPAPNNRWYANVPLSPDQHTPLTLQIIHQNEGFSEWRRIQWLPLNLLNAENMTIRTGDSLFMTASPDSTATGAVFIVIGTNRLVTTAQNPLSYRFNQAGTFTVTGTYDQTRSRSITVKVVGHSFSSDPACWVATRRDWDVPSVPPEVVFEADSRVIFEHMAGSTEQERRIGLIADRNEPRYVVSRLGPRGPILDSARLNTFDFWHAEGTYLKVLRKYEDGSELVEMLLVLSPVPPDLTVQLDVIAGGVAFQDGSSTLSLTATDFDARGRSVVRFLRPASAQTSVCHSIKLLQGSALVGSVR
jgi:hypothetical protein